MPVLHLSYTCPAIPVLRRAMTEGTAEFTAPWVYYCCQGAQPTYVHCAAQCDTCMSAHDPFCTLQLIYTTLRLMDMSGMHLVCCAYMLCCVPYVHVVLCCALLLCGACFLCCIVLCGAVRCGEYTQVYAGIVRMPCAVCTYHVLLLTPTYRGHHFHNVGMK